jgi:hypothetical protein
MQDYNKTLNLNSGVVILTSGEGDGEGEKVEEIGGCTVMN